MDRNNPLKILDEGVNSVLAAGIVVFVILPLAVIWAGWVLQLFWLWFVVPFGARPVTLPEAAGLVLTYSFIKAYFHYNQEELGREEQSRRALNDLYRAVTVPLVYLVVGWLLHLMQ